MNIHPKIKRWILRYEKTNFVYHEEGKTVPYFQNKMAAKIVRNRHNATSKQKVYVSPGPDHNRYPTFRPTEESLSSRGWA